MPRTADQIVKEIMETVVMQLADLEEEDQLEVMEELHDTVEKAADSLRNELAGEEDDDDDDDEEYEDSELEDDDEI